MGGEVLITLPIHLVHMGREVRLALLLLGVATCRVTDESIHSGMSLDNYYIHTMYTLN